MKVNSQQYLDIHTDVKTEGTDPLFHYLTYGQAEGRQVDLPELPPDWDWEQYLAANRDLRAASYDTKEEAESHYLNHGHYEHRPLRLVIPLDWEDAAYLFKYPDVAADGYYFRFPLAHFRDTEATENRLWKPEGWSTAQYRENYPTEDFGANPLLHWWKDGEREGRSYKKPAPPEPTGEIKSWKRLDECYNKDACYFSIEGDLMGEYGYQYNEHSSVLYKYPHQPITPYEAESIISMLDGIRLLENGGPRDKAQIWYDGELRWEHLKSTLSLEIIKHSDGFYYVTHKDYNDRGEPGGWVRSSDKINWSDAGRGQDQDFLAGMASNGADLITAGTFGGTDWGSADCYPVAYKNRNRAWSLPNRKGSGGWGVAVYKGQILIGLTGAAGVWNVTIGNVVDFPGFETIHAFQYDGEADMLIAFVNKDSSKFTSGAVAMATKDGHSWKQLGAAFPCPLLFQAQQRADGTVRAVGGRWSQQDGGWGDVFDSIR